MSAVYSIFTSPNHAPVPDHLPTLIVTPHGRPSHILYTYIHTNVNKENYLLTPVEAGSDAGDLCVAKLFPSSSSSGSTSGHGSTAGEIRCEASRNLRWSIINTGIQNAVYKAMLPNPDVPEQDQPLFQVSKPNPNAGWWTLFYFTYAGHLIPPKRVEFGRIQKNGAEAGGGTRVSITGKTDEEKAVWKTLGDGNEDMVEWIVLCAALTVLDDEIVQAAEKAGLGLTAGPVMGGKLPRVGGGGGGPSPAAGGPFRPPVVRSGSLPSSSSRPPPQMRGNPPPSQQQPYPPSHGPPSIPSQQQQQQQRPPPPQGYAPQRSASDYRARSPAPNGRPPLLPPLNTAQSYSSYGNGPASAPLVNGRQYPPDPRALSPYNDQQRQQHQLQQQRLQQQQPPQQQQYGSGPPPRQPSPQPPRSPGPGGPDPRDPRYQRFLAEQQQQQQQQQQQRGPPPPGQLASRAPSSYRPGPPSRPGPPMDGERSGGGGGGYAGAGGRLQQEVEAKRGAVMGQR